MQNFTIDSEGNHHFRSSAALDTQEIESRYLGELNTKNTSIVVREEIMKGSSNKGPARIDTTLGLTLVNSNSKVLQSRQSDREDVN